MAIRAVCFDLGGVVARISYHWAEMLQRNGFPVPEHILPDHDLHYMPVFEAYQTGDVSTEQYFEVLADYLGRLSTSQAEQVHRNMLIEPFPGVLEIVQELNARGIKTGCLSNTNAPHWEELVNSERFPAIRSMQVQLASFEIDVSKPDPGAFREFEKAAGCIGSEILLFDDSLPNCEAAAWLGWQVLHIDPHGDPARQMRARLIDLDVL